MSELNMLFLSIIIIFLPILLCWAIYRDLKNHEKQYVCRNCGHIGERSRYVPGSLIIEILLWFTFVIPGLIYTLWRCSAKYYVCARCCSRSIIPVDSPWTDFN